MTNRYKNIESIKSNGTTATWLKTKIKHLKNLYLEYGSEQYKTTLKHIVYCITFSATTILFTIITSQLISAVIEANNSLIENSEKWSLTNGTSHWPIILIRLFSIYLIICFLFKNISKYWIQLNRFDIEFDFTFSNNWKRNQNSLEKYWFILLTLQPIRFFLYSGHNIIEKTERRPPPLIKLKGSKPEAFGVKMTELWTLYKGASHPLCSFLFSIIVAAFLTALIKYQINLATQGFNISIRGESAQFWNHATKDAFIFSVIFQLAYVFWNTAIGYKMIRLLINNRSIWPESLISASTFDYKERHKEELLETKFIAFHTEFVGKLIVAPFAVLFLILIITNNYFDYTFLPTNVYFLIFLLLVVSLLLAANLRSVAERARSKSIESLNELQLNLAEEPRNKELREKVRDVIEDIKSQSKGAFSPFSQNPIVYAVLLPFGGAGSLVFIESLFRYFA